MNPFDLKAALLAKYAQHPAVIRFPIALIYIFFALATVLLIALAGHLGGVESGTT
jgi:hypothetical protein